MGIVRKILLAFLVLVALFFLLLIVTVLTYKPSFEVRSIRIVDHDDSPCFKISFKTSDYPIKFYLLTKEGELIDTYVADKPEEVVYLYLTPGKSFTNIVGPKSYVIRAFYEDKEVYSSSFDINGAKADLKIKDVSFEAFSSSLGLKGLTIEVRNEGDVPLYPIRMNIELYLDNSHASSCSSFSYSPINPGDVSSLSLICYSSIASEDLDKEHRVDIVIHDIARTSYTIEPLNVGLRIDNVGISSLYGEGWSVNNITLTISNRGRYPINAKWVKAYVNEKPILVLLPESLTEIIEPGEEKTVTYKYFSVPTSRPFTLKVRLGATEISYSG
jgi:hypothetical protein